MPKNQHCMNSRQYFFLIWKWSFQFVSKHFFYSVHSNYILIYWFQRREFTFEFFWNKKKKCKNWWMIFFKKPRVNKILMINRFIYFAGSFMTFKDYILNYRLLSLRIYIDCRFFVRPNKWFFLLKLQWIAHLRLIKYVSRALFLHCSFKQTNFWNCFFLFNFILIFCEWKFLFQFH